MVAATKFGPCGFLCDDQRPCHCKLVAIGRSTGTISAPLLNRIYRHIMALVQRRNRGGTLGLRITCSADH